MMRPYQTSSVRQAVPPMVFEVSLQLVTYPGALRYMHIILQYNIAVY